MAKKLYTDEMKEYLAEIVPGRRMNEVAKLMNKKFGTDFTESQMRNLKSRLRLKNGLPTNSKGLQKKMTTKEQDEFIRENYKGLYNKDLTDLVNEQFGTKFTVEQIKAYKARNKLNSGVGGHFEKGHEPFNKGLKQEDYMSPEAIKKSKTTRFQKGERPPNWEPIGYERITRDGYIEVKVRDGHKQRNFELKHRYLWEKEHGKVPKGYVLLFKNGDPLDVRLDNLMLVERAVLLHLNKQELLSEYPELNEAAVNLIKLYLKTSEVNM